MQFVALKNENKTEHTPHKHTTQRDKQDWRDVIGVRQTSGLSAWAFISTIISCFIILFYIF